MRSAWVVMAGGLALLLWSGLVMRWLADSPPAKFARVATPAQAVVHDPPLAALELRPVDGGLLLSGEVPSAASAAELISKARVMYAPLAVEDGLRVRAEAEQADWLGSALAVMPLPMPGIEQPEWLVSAAGLRIGGVAADAEVRRALQAQIAQRFPDLPLHDAVRQLAPSPKAAPAAVQATSAAPDRASEGAEPAPPAPAASTAIPAAGAVSAALHPRQAEIDALLAARPVMFASGSTRLRREGGPDWRALARILREVEGLVRVRGHTDDRGDPAANRRLSARRAEAVKQALVRAGVPAARIRVEGVGADEPRVANDTAEGRRQNRRIELRLEVGS